MNGPGDIPLTQGATPERPCGLISIIPTLGMSSCRGRAEAFARRLQSKLRTLGSQNEDTTSQEEEPIINGGTSNTWITSQESGQTVTDLQPLRHESDSFFDFDCDLESPGSPVDECEYLRLIESASNTPHNSAAESGYACTSVASSHSSSSDGPYYDPDSSENADTQQIHFQQPRLSGISEYVKCLKINEIHEIKEVSEPKENNLTNGHTSESHHVDSSFGHTSESHQEDSSFDHTSESHQADSSFDHTSESHHEDSNIIEQQHPQLPAESSESESLPPSQDSSEIEQATEIENSIETQDLVLAELQNQSSNLNVNHNGHSSDDDSQDTLQLPQDDKIGLNEFTDDIKLDNDDLPLTESEIHEMQNLPGENEILSIIIEPDNLTSTETQSDRGKITSVLDTDDEDDCRPQRLRRCSSLKTGKTPPGTPGRKKIVRFADVLGLDLADVKTFLDEIPTIPKSAFEDLEILEAEPPIQLGPKSDKLLMPLFQQPGGLPTFLDQVRDKQVSLENAAVTDHINQTISGCVRVRNLDFHKSVHIRYTIDNWRTFADLQATYVENSCDGFSDKFTFVLFGNSMHVGQRLEFAVRFQCKGQQFWDSNYGANYCFQCLPATSPATLAPLPSVIPSRNNINDMSLMSPAAGETWCGFY